MWTFSRENLEATAPFLTLIAMGFLGFGIWRFAVGDSHAGLPLTFFAAFWAVCAGAGWIFRRTGPDDPWAPR